MAALAALVAMLVPLTASRAADGSQDVVEVGVLPRLSPDVLAAFGDGIDPHKSSDLFAFQQPYGTLLVFPEVRQLWQVFMTFEGQPESLVAVRDLDTLQLKHTMRIGALMSRLPNYFGGQWIHAVDPGRRVFLSVNDRHAFVEVDLRTFEVKPPVAFEPTGDVQGRTVAINLGGLHYDKQDDALLGVYSIGGSVASAPSLLMKRDLKAGQNSAARQIRSCNGQLPTSEGHTYQTAIQSTPSHIYIVCMRAGASGAVARLERRTVVQDGSPEDFAVGPVQVETSLSDPTSGRLFLITQKGEIWAFDVETMSFVGVVSAYEDTKQPNLNIGYGIDQSTGRIFFQSPSYGLGVAEGRFFPIPQAKTTPIRADGHEWIVSDAKTNRIFVLEGHGTDREAAYKIYKVGAAPEPPATTDPDRNTVDRVEDPSATESRFFASGSGFGLRAVYANGVVTAVPAIGIGGLSPFPILIADHVNSKCGFTDRELTAGRVVKAQYDSGSTAAEAVGVGLDERTKLDLERPSRCDAMGRSSSFNGFFSTSPAHTEELRKAIDNPEDGEPRWNHSSAVCTSSEGDTAAADEKPDPGELQVGEARVSCPTPGGELRADAVGHLVGPLRVGDATSKVTVTRDKLGVHVITESWSKDIGIADNLVQIAEIRAVAQSTSNGRPRKGDMSTYSMEIKGLRVEGKLVCEACDPASTVDTLNTVLAGRARFRLGAGMDERLRKGTPKGALTAVQKSPERQASDQSLVGDFSTEIPALEMINYNDNSYWGRARQLYQFAGVGTAATYNIVNKPEAFLPGSDGGILQSVVESSPVDPDLGFGNVKPQPAPKPRAGSDGDDTNPFTRALRAVVRGVRMFVSNPREALLLLTGWALLALPVVLNNRRRLLAGIDDPVG